MTSGYFGSGSLSTWTFAPGVDEDIQVNLSYSYSDNTYSRGHQIANADRNGVTAMQEQTYYSVNSTPQIQNGFNSGVWSDLEGALRTATPSGDSLYVATGPVYRTVGGSESISYTTAKADTKQCPVPNYYFKVVLKVKRSGGQVTDAKAVGFWFEHKSYTGTGVTYDKYAVSVDEIERRTGFDFFANLPDSIESSAEQNAGWAAFKSF